MVSSTEAAKIAASLVWRLEVLQYRAKFSSSGDLTRLPVRVRRFSNALPAGSVCEVLEAIVNLAPYSGVRLFNGNSGSGSETYLPSSTYIRKDDTLKSGTKDPTYTIVQDLRMSGSTDAEAFTDESSCARETSAVFRWDENSVPDVGSGGQGVTKRIVNVQRDKETDLFSYQIETSTALTQHVPQYVEACSEVETRTVEMWDNVYGSPGNYLYDSVRHSAGTSVEVPAPCSADQGELVEVSVSENDDCTFKIRVVRTVSKVSSLSEYQRYRDAFNSKSVSLDSRSRSRLPTAAPNPDGGVKTTYEVKENPDGTFENRTTVDTELPVSSALVEYRKTLRGFTTTVTDRNQYSPVSSSGMSIGDVRSSKKTEGGLYDNSVQSAVKLSVGDVGSSCETTVFQHQHTASRNEADRPSEEADSAGEGKTYQVTAKATEEGTWDVSRTTVTEIPVPEAQKVVQKSLRGVTTTTVDRNSTDGTATVSKVGDRVQVEKTPGGLYNRTVTSVSSESVGDVGSSCETTVFQHQHTESRNEADRPSAEAESAGGGKTYQVTAKATEEGTWDVSRTTVTEISVPEAQKVVQKSLRGVTVTTVDRNSANGSATVSKVGDRVQIEKTPGGRYNRTVTSVSPVSVGDIYNSVTQVGTVETITASVVNTASSVSPGMGGRSPNMVNKVAVKATDEGTFDVETESRVYSPVTTVATSSWATEKAVTTTVSHNTSTTASAGTGEATSSPDDTGAATTRVTEYTPIPVDSGWISWTSEVKTPTSTLKYKCAIRVFKNASSLPSVSSGADVGCNVSINKFGRYDGSITTRELISWKVDGSGSSSTSGIQSGEAYGPPFSHNGVLYHAKYDVTVYYGSGNEGSKANSMSTATYVSGAGGCVACYRFVSLEKVNG